EYKPVGSLASLGHRQAVAQIGKYRLSGLPAWFAWRAIYLAKLPNWGDKMRVGLDWLTNLFAPVDTAQLPIMREDLVATMTRLVGTALPPTAQRDTPMSSSAAEPIAR